MCQSFTKPNENLIPATPVQLLKLSGVLLVFGLLVFLFGVVCLVLRALEPSLLFHPRTDKEWFPLAPDFEELVLRNQTSAIWCPLAHAERVVLYCHGNYGNISMRGDWVRALQLHLGASVLLFDYPGFGKTPGKPNESGCYASAQSAFDWLLANGWKRGQIVLCGKSLGAAIALEMATRHPNCHASVLIDPFSNVPDAANVLLRVPLGWLAKNRFDNLAKIGEVAMPKIIVGAELDHLCPAWMARKLGEAAREPKSVRVVNGRVHAEFLVESEWRWIAASLDEWRTRN